MLLVTLGTDPTLPVSLSGAHMESMEAMQAMHTMDPRLPGLRRAVQATRSLASMKRQSLSAQCKFQTDMLLDLVAKTQTHFLFFLLPQHNAGLCQLKQQYSIGAASTGTSDPNAPITIGVPPTLFTRVANRCSLLWYLFTLDLDLD